MSINTIKAAINRNPELLPRLLAVCEPMTAYPKAVTSADDAVNVLRGHLDGRTTEAFCILGLDRKSRPIGTKVLTTGNDSFCIVDPKQVLAWALRQGPHGASAIIVAHNHPSGDLNPSPQDIQVTRRLLKACESVGIRFLDHLIITADGSSSCMTA
jgi:DNA repair protein RadC